MRNARTLCLALALAAPALVSASGWTTGVLTVQRDSAYRGMGTDTLAVPFAQFEGERFWWRGLAAGVRVHENGAWRFDALLQARMDGLDRDDSAFFSGMTDRRRSLDAGLQLRRESPIGEWRVTALTDTLGRHQGSELQLGWQTDWRRGPLLVQPGLSASWQSGALVNHYFGVRPSGARPGRAAYQADAGWRHEASLSAILPISSRWALFGRIGVQRLPTSAADSPLVDGNTERSLLLGFGYRWGTAAR